MTDQPTAVPPQPQIPQPPSQPATGGGFLDVKRNFKHLVIVLAVFGALVIGWIVFKQTLSATTKGKVAPVFGGGPKELLSQTLEVSDDRWRTFTFRLEHAATLEVEWDVLTGDKVTTYVIDDAQRETFAQASTSLTGGEFRHYPALEGKNKKQHRAYGHLPPGAYAIVLSESSSPNILGKADKATVKLKLSTR